MLLIKQRTQCQWRSSCAFASFGNIVPSDQAFVDVILEEERSRNLSEDIRVESTRTTSGIHQVTTVYEHKVLYKGEDMFTLETKSHYDRIGTWGQSSTCVLRNGNIKIKINNKGKMALGGGWNARETRYYSVQELVHQSAEARKMSM
jgi:hypothetical protein